MDVFQNQGVCRQAFPSFPSPTPSRDPNFVRSHGNACYAGYLLSDRPIDIHISGYESIRSDRSTNGRSRGGVGFYTRFEMNYSVRSDLICEHIESLTVEIKKPRSRPFAFMTWYRPPNSSIDIFRPFEELIGKLDSENIEYYFIVLYFISFAQKNTQIIT